MEIPGASLTKLEDHSNYGLPVHPSSKRQLTSTQEAGGEGQYIVEKLVQHRKDANWRPGGLDTKHSKSLLCRKPTKSKEDSDYRLLDHLGSNPVPNIIKIV